MLEPVVKNVLIDLVGDDIGAVLLAKSGDHLHFLAGEDLARRIGRSVKDHRLGTLGESLLQFTRVQGPIWIPQRMNTGIPPHRVNPGR